MEKDCKQNGQKQTEGCESIIIGDMNLDMVTWDNPVQNHKAMVENVKTEIETKGFSQVIENITRSWPGTEDSLIDHVWFNFLEKNHTKNSTLQIPPQTTT